MKIIIYNDGILRRIPWEGSRKAVHLKWNGREGMIVSRKLMGSYRIAVTSDLRVKFEHWNPSDPMTIKELEEIFDLLHMDFKVISKGE